MSYTLNSNQIAYITELKDLGKYHLAYKYIADQMEGAVQSGAVSRETQRWFEWAEQINGGAGNVDHFNSGLSLLTAAMTGAQNSRHFQKEYMH